MANLKKNIWSKIDVENLPQEDSLLACLVLLTRYYQNPLSSQALTARLAIDAKLTPNVFAQAAERASLNTQLQEQSIGKIADSSLPVVLLLENNEACLLIQDEHGQRQFINPLAPTQHLEREQIITQYIGQAIFVQPADKYSVKIDDELPPATKGFWFVIWSYLSVYVEIVIASLFINLFALAIPLFIMNIYDRILPNNTTDTLWVLASGIAIVFIFNFLLKTIRAYFIDQVSKGSEIESAGTIFQRILSLSMANRPKSVGKLANIIQSYAVIRDNISSTTVSVLVDLPFIIIFILTIFLIGGPLVWIPVISLPILFIIGFLFQIPLIKLVKQSYKYNTEKQATLIESLANIETIKITSSESVFQSHWEHLIHLLAQGRATYKLLTNISANLLTLIQQIAIITMLILGVYLISSEYLTFGALIACILLTMLALTPIARFTFVLGDFYQSRHALKSLNQILQLPGELTENNSFSERPALSGDIELQQVSYRYNTAKNFSLSNLNIQISAGEKIAIMGRSGAGKSTLARLLLKLYTPTGGLILFEGIDYRQINTDDIRQQIGYVPQDISLFHGTIKENICMGLPYVEKDVLLQASHLAGLNHFTNRHPDGWNRQIGERGSDLSHAERQAIAITRAFMNEPKVLILDDATSAMDDLSEQEFKKQLTEYLGINHTLLLISNKLSMLELVDRIIVLDEGKLIADGSKELILSTFSTELTIERKIL